MSENQPVLGIIGGGQLGSFLCDSAKKIDVETVVLSDDKESPAKNFCNKFIYSEYSNFDKIKEFTSLVDVVTFEFENIPFKILDFISKFKPVLPKPDINKIVQDRFTEKKFIRNTMGLLNELDIRLSNYALIKNKSDISKNKHLLPGFLKTRTLGYDGKGQFFIKNEDEIDKLEIIFDKEYILEKKINLKKEISIIVTRFLNNECLIFAPFENYHVDQILSKSIIPADINKNILIKAEQQAKLFAEQLNYIGTMCVEFFIDENNNLLVNEIAPRVHNSGHLTINAYNVSQFENHIRAVCSLEIIKLKKTHNAKMINVIGEDIKAYRKRTYSKNEFFYDYFKKEIKKNRKMGHITILSD
ncbi:5-(carboxyamino)imidazole ribonucleotide synthase [Pelagibacteraceae bacterium]|nr:5-(carboxyamino)imidazole ribonucleotide synthase [Pelagibacteraceae bacterium]